MSQVPDETSSSSSDAVQGGGADGAASDLESAMARAAEAAGDEGDEGEESSSEGEGSEEGGDAAAAGGAPAKKKRRRRRKKKPGEASASSAGGEAAPAGEAPHRAEAKPERPRREHALPFNRYFGDGPPRKSLLAAGEIVGGRVIAVEHGIAVLDLFGRGIAFALDNEPREIPVLTEPAAEEPAAEASSEAGAPNESAEPASEATAGEASAPVEAASSTESSAHESSTHETSSGEGAPEEAPAAVDEVSHPKLEVGDVLRARIASVSESGHIAVANRIVLRAESRAALAKAREEHRRVWGTVYGFNRGGFDVLVEGIRAFCPVSGMTLEPLDDPREALGRRLEFSVQAAKSGHQGVVVSRRSLLERDNRRRARELRRQLEVGKRVKGKVTGVRDFGFFVDLGGIEGLVHMSEVSWDRHVRPADAVSVGDEVEVMILRLGGPEGREGRDNDRRDRRDGRIGLSLKATQADPWESKVAEIEEGSVRKGRITRTTEFGAFIELVPGVEGLLHISELGRDLKHANERLKEGEDLYVVVERLDVRAKRISLSKLSDSDKKLIEQGGELPSGGQKSLRVGTHLKVKVEKVEPAGLFVQVEGVIGRRGRGFIPNAEMGTERGTDHRKKFPPGLELDVKVVGNDRDGGLRLSRKGFHNDEERRAVHDYRREAASKGFGTFGDLLRNKLQK
ncbi:MAG: S1 RNA-binding domain-containing protein [Deltaproteobacteria bacterium]|nr:S1 RNA-binding domain-containing protein [Deltaproteobacteria bacterium]